MAPQSLLPDHCTETKTHFKLKTIRNSLAAPACSPCPAPSPNICELNTPERSTNLFLFHATAGPPFNASHAGGAGSSPGGPRGSPPRPHRAQGGLPPEPPEPGTGHGHAQVGTSRAAASSSSGPAASPAAPSPTAPHVFDTFLPKKKKNHH